MKITDDSRHYI